MSCSAESALAGTELAGTATRASRWLLVEHRGRWGRDATADPSVPDAVSDFLEGFDGRVLLLRRPRSATRGVAVFRADSDEAGGVLRRRRLDSLDGLAAVDLEEGEEVAEPLVLVCAHGRRDPCCARLGPPVFDALDEHLPDETLWQSSHHGGHRFAANVLVLPWGVQLGRALPEEAAGIAALLRDGRIPLDRYRGRTLYPPALQAAEVAIRRTHGLDGVAALRLLEADGGEARFGLPDGEVVAHVEQVPGPVVPASCGDEPAATSAFTVTLESLA